jgi:hypothetical protein
MLISSFIIMILCGIIPFIIGLDKAIKKRKERIEFLSGMPTSYKYEIDNYNPEIFQGSAWGTY